MTPANNIELVLLKTSLVLVLFYEFSVQEISSLILDILKKNSYIFQTNSSIFVYYNCIDIKILFINALDIFHCLYGETF